MRFGVAHLAAVLAGQDSEKIRSFGHHRLSVFGIADEAEQRLIRPVARALLARDALRADEHGGLSFGPAARAILKGEEQVPLVLPPRRERRRRGGTETAWPEDPLFDALRACRRELAKAQGVPPYVIFHDSTLRDMAALKPRNRSEMGQVSGVGERKLDAYGDAFLDAIRAFQR
jgi:ATP-dependent DNA helicase RecQ